VAENLSKLDTVHRFFSGTGSSYDRVVVLGTCGLDRYWKRRMLARIPERPAHIIDQACGTGIVTIEIARRHPDCQVTGVELRDEYLQHAREKARSLGMRNVAFVLGRAEDVVVAGPCDCITSSYLAKYADLPMLIANAARMLRPGGLMILHDFTCPTRPVFRWVWQVYLWLLRLIGRSVFPEWRTVFDELPAFLRQTRWVAESTALLAENGFRDVATEPLTFGAAAIVTARKPESSPR
jgi:demethylmenaquinone methyltransferase / 2-methoxy-6-polyprenyl-1,4-benzoquinol methylase